MTSTVLITGASRGIGHALAVSFAHAGWSVLAGARRPDVPALTGLRTTLPNLHPVQFDVTDDASVARAIAAHLADRPLDILVNNAAIFPGEGDETLDRLDLDWFAEAIEVNVTGVARVTRACLPALRQSPHPRVANISSGAGSISDKDDFAYYPYSVSKAGLNLLTRAMAAEFRPENITITALSPGWVQTEMGGPHATITPQESAAALFETLTTLTLAQSGLFLSRHGTADDYRW